MSHTPQSLWSSRRFLPMFFTQFFGAFNDNIYKYALLMVITYGWVSRGELSISTLNNLAALLFVLPFFIFSATAGQIADRYERAQLIRWLKIFEIGTMLLASIGFFWGNLPLLLLALFLMGSHSTFFGPIKYAILPDILSDQELMLGNALFQSGTSLAILLGMVIGGLMISLSAGSMWWISATVLVVAGLGYLSSRMILPQPIADQKLQVNWNFWVTSGQILKLSYAQPLIFLILLANSWYWFYGATLITQIPELTLHYLHANENVSSVVLTFFSVGVVIGSVCCKKFSAAQLNLKLVPIGAIGLSGFGLYLAWALSLLSPAPSQQALIGIAQVFQQGAASMHVFAAVTLLGISGGFYIVPLYAMMQAQSPESQRARIVAANNILNAVFMVSAALFSIVILSLFQLDLLHLFAINAMLSALVCGLLLYKIRPRLP
jgi:MFS family permease